MKYIIAHLPGESMAAAILFAPFLGHKTIATLLGLTSGNITSAGFCRIDGDGKVECAGFSTSLGLGPSIVDAELISACIRHTNELYPAKPAPLAVRQLTRGMTGDVFVDEIGLTHPSTSYPLRFPTSDP